MWYTKRESPLRIGVWDLGRGTSTIVGALASFAFQHYSSETFTAWQILFLVAGIMTVAVGVCVVVLLPDNPMSAPLSTSEKICAIERIRNNRTGIENKKWKSRQTLECLRDPHTWLICLITISANVCGGAVGSYQATIIQE